MSFSLRVTTSDRSEEDNGSGSGFSRSLREVVALLLTIVPLTFVSRVFVLDSMSDVISVGKDWNE